MWKQFWKTWTIDKPAALGDLLWEIFVVQFAAFLDRLTLRRVIALVPLVIIGLAYHHSIPLPPELMLVGDFFAYIDVFAMLFLLGILSRAATILLIARQSAAQTVRLVNGLVTVMRRLDFRHRREGGVRRSGQPGRRARADEDEPAVMGAVAWA